MNNFQPETQIGTHRCRSITVPFTAKATVNEDIIMEKELAPQIESFEALIRGIVNIIEKDIRDSVKTSFEESDLKRIFSKLSDSEKKDEQLKLKNELENHAQAILNRLVYSSKNAILFQRDRPLIERIQKVAQTPHLLAVQALIQKTADLVSESISKERESIRKDKLVTESLQKSAEQALANSNGTSASPAEIQLFTNEIMKVADAVVDKAKTTIWSILYRPEIDALVQKIATNTAIREMDPREGRTFSELLRNLNFRSISMQLSNGATTDVNSLVDNLVAKLNHHSHEIAKEFETEIQSAISVIYPEPQVIVNISFKKGSLVMICNVILGWSGGIVLQTTKEFFKTQIGNLTTIALERSWSIMMNGLGLSEYLGPLPIKLNEKDITTHIESQTDSQKLLQTEDSKSNYQDNRGLRLAQLQFAHLGK